MAARQNTVVYGELGRRGIYDFHDMYRLLGERRNPALARKLVAALPDTSWLKKNKNMLTGDFEKFGDSGVTDLLVSISLTAVARLHMQTRAHWAKIDIASAF